MSNAALTAISAQIAGDIFNNDNGWFNAVLTLSRSASGQTASDLVQGLSEWNNAVATIAAAILADPANLLVTDAAGAVTTTGGGTADLTPVLTRLDTVDTELERVKKVGEPIRHTLVSRVDGVSNTTVETRP